jgi:carbamate kinase
VKPVAVIAIGGNSLILPGERGSFEDQQRNARTTCEGVADVIAAGYRVVLTHGNGPQVGGMLLRGELAQPHLPALRLDECDAETQGDIGYLLQQTLANALAGRGLHLGVVTLITQVVVDLEDPAFRNPTKPIGPFYRFEEALERKQKLGWAMVEDSGRGWRRVVPSPRPLEIVETHAIRACLGAGVVVIAAGGGGVPVARRNGQLRGVEAVVDKDRSSSLLATTLHAETLLFSTAVERVAWHFGKSDERALERLEFAEAERFLREGEFPAGSMGPKIQAALEFLRAGGRRAIVTSPEKIGLAIHGGAGTAILAPARTRDREAVVA